MSRRSLEKDAVVIGAGISGLATAYRLQKAGLDVLVLEKSTHVGGAIRTEEIDGFIVDHGPNSTLDTSPKIRDFIKEIGLQDDRVTANANASHRYILKNGKLLPLPMNPSQLVQSKLFSLKSKLRLLREPFISAPSPDKEETIAEFVARRLGKEFLDYAINPFVAGVYAGDPSQLSVRSAVSKIYALEKNYGSLIKGAIQGAKRRKKGAETAKTTAELFSFEKGMGQLSTALKSILAKTIETEAALEIINLPSDRESFCSINYTSPNKKINVRTKSLIFTTPAYVTADYLKPFDELLAAKLYEITYAPVAVVFLGFRTKVLCRPLDGFGFLVPEVENRKILGTIWNSSIFPNRVRGNGAALTTFVGGMRQPELVDLNDKELSNLVSNELKEIMGLYSKPDILKVKRWHKAIAQYELGHQRHIDMIEKFESERPGIFISGSFKNGISVGDCIIQSGSVAKKVLQFYHNSLTLSKVSDNVTVL